MDHQLKQLVTYAGQVLAAVIVFNVICAGAAYLMHDGPLLSVAYRKLTFFLNGDACGLDLTTWNGRLTVVLGFLALVINGYRKGAFNAKE